MKNVTSRFLIVFQEFRHLLRSPSSFYQEIASLPAWSKHLIITFFALAAVMLVPIGLSSILPYNEMRTATAGARTYYLALDVDPTLVLFPANLLLFPLNWLIYGVVWGGLRKWFIGLLGDPKPGFRDMLGMTLSAASPIMVTGAVIRTVNNLWQFRSMVPESGFLYARLACTVALFLIAFALDGRNLISAAKAILGQTRGKAVLMWLFPPVVVIATGYVLLSLLAFC